MRAFYLGQLNSSRYNYVFIIPIRDLETYLGQVRELGMKSESLQVFYLECPKIFWTNLSETWIRWLTFPSLELPTERFTKPLTEKEQDAPLPSSETPISHHIGQSLKKKKSSSPKQTCIFFDYTGNACSLEKIQKLYMNKRRKCKLHPWY